MLTQTLLVLHIAVLGYWLGSELVINSTFRYVSYQVASPFTERARLMEHVMTVDQHVRYALALQASLGTALAALYGYVPGGARVAVAAGVAGVVWLVFIEIVHRLRHRPIGQQLAKIDRVSRYVLLAVLLALATGWVGADWPTPAWLRWKFGLFAAVIACGVGIRLALIGFFRTWARMAQTGVTPADDASVQTSYRTATSILVLLWGCIAAIVTVSILKFV